MKACTRCANYQSGKGNMNCLACKKYETIGTVQEARKAPRIVPVVSIILEALPGPDPPADPLMALMRGLPAHHAAVIAMRYYANLSIQDLADMIGVSPQAASERVHRAVLCLKKNITKQYPHITTYRQGKTLIQLSH
jgi:hypothetical protein